MSDRRYDLEVDNPSPEDLISRVDQLRRRLELVSQTIAEDVEFPGLRIDHWSDGLSSVLWFRSTVGTRVRGSIRLCRLGFRVSVRGPIHLRFWKHPVVKRLECLLETIPTRQTVP